MLLHSYYTYLTRLTSLTYLTSLTSLTADGPVMAVKPVRLVRCGYARAHARTTPPLDQIEGSAGRSTSTLTRHLGLDVDAPRAILAALGHASGALTAAASRSRSAVSGEASAVKGEDPGSRRSHASGGRWTPPLDQIEGSAGRSTSTLTRHLGLDVDAPRAILAALGHASGALTAAASRSRSAVSGEASAVKGEDPGSRRSHASGGRWTPRMQRNGGRD